MTRMGGVERGHRVMARSFTSHSHRFGCRVAGQRSRNIVAIHSLKQKATRLAEFRPREKSEHRVGWRV